MSSGACSTQSSPPTAASITRRFCRPKRPAPIPVVVRWPGDVPGRGRSCCPVGCGGGSRLPARQGHRRSAGWRRRGRARGRDEDDGEGERQNWAPARSASSSCRRRVGSGCRSSTPRRSRRRSPPTWTEGVVHRVPGDASDRVRCHAPTAAHRLDQEHRQRAAQQRAVRDHPRQRRAGRRLDRPLNGSPARRYPTASRASRPDGRRHRGRRGWRTGRLRAGRRRRNHRRNARETPPRTPSPVATMVPLTGPMAPATTRRTPAAGVTPAGVTRARERVWPDSSAQVPRHQSRTGSPRRTRWRRRLALDGDPRPFREPNGPQNTHPTGAADDNNLPRGFV